MDTVDRNALWLIDGSSFIFRAYHAMADLRSRDGTPTGAVYGFISMVEGLLGEEGPEYVVVALDTGEPTFREEVYKDYKANREAAPEDVTVQFPLVRRWIEYMGVAVLEMPGFEADDVIGTLARAGAAKGFQVRILTGDKDLLQLVTDDIHVVRDTPSGRTDYDRAAVLERYGVAPERFPDLLGLVGDASDNIPGVPMIGEKTAVTLLQKYESLEGLYDHAAEIGGKRGESIRESRDKAFLSRELATVRTDVPLDIGIERLRKRERNTEALRSFYEELGFSSYLKKLGDEPRPIQDEDYAVVDSLPALDKLVAELRKVPRFSIDTETTSVHPTQADLVGISISTREGSAAYIPVGHLEGKQISLSDVRKVLGPVLSDPAVVKIGHHIKYDEIVLRRAGFDLVGIEFDTMLAALILEETGTGLSLENLSRKHTSKAKLPSDNLFGKGYTIDAAAIESAAQYACRDAEVSLLLYNHYIGFLREEPNRNLFYEMEMPLSGVLAQMEMVGVRVVPEILARQSKEVGEMADKLAGEIFREVGNEFNLNSTQQLADILYDRLGLLKGRKRTTKADVLEQLAKEGHTFAKSVLEYRHLKKLKSTYLDALPQLINSATGRVHTSYSQTRAATGRISSSDPNLQNIPIRSELGKRIREAFVPEEGYTFFSGDYSQIELRVVAHFSGDPGLVGAFERGEDIHQRTAADIFGVPLGEVTSDQRSRAKAINFGLHYGMTEHGLADRLGISVEEARDYMRIYFERFPSVRAHIDKTIREATSRGYTTTLLGRRIYVEGLNSPNRTIQQNAQRAAINAPIQGTAADMLKLAMVRIARRVREEGLKSRMILTVHDEIILEVYDGELEQAAQIAVEEMENALPLSVSVKVNTRTGPDWASLS